MCTGNNGAEEPEQNLNKRLDHEALFAVSVTLCCVLCNPRSYYQFNLSLRRCPPFSAEREKEKERVCVRPCACVKSGDVTTVSVFESGTFVRHPLTAFLFDALLYVIIFELIQP